MTTPYIIVRASSLESLSVAVNAHMEQGYAPVGGPFVSCVNTFSQAVWRASASVPTSPQTEIPRGPNPKKR